jgi:DNA-binding transcriptional regulator LsrR (DeoR family)
VLYNFIDRDGKLVNHPVNERSIALSLEGLARIGNRALIAGGVEKRAIILATLKLVRPRILVTDEVTARHLLDQPVEPADR